jgi:hypothetical protein
MLTFPEVLSMNGVVVFPDDEDPNVFYLLSEQPRLRMDNGKPVFRGLFWTDDASGANPGVAGLRGALLHFDVNLAITQQAQNAILDEIKRTGVQQQRVEQMEQDEKERIARMARATGADGTALPKPRVPEIREPRIGSVQFTGGTVSLLEEKDGGFVAWSSAGGPPSLIGDNNSAFALRLGPEGAAVWYRGLEQDATAIGIKYELKFQARLPSLQIHVWAGSHQHMDVTRSAERVITNMDQGCSDSDVEHIDVKTLTQKLVEEGLVNVEIIKGTAKVSDEQVSQLRNTAISLISDRVKEILMNKIKGMTEEERRSSLLSKFEEEVTAFAELRLTQRDVIEWSVNPQATLTEFLGGTTGDARKKLITLVDLSDPVVSTLEVDVSADAAWDGDPNITRVIVTVEYPPARDNPQGIQTFAFDKANPAPQKFRCRRVARDRGTLTYSAVASVKGSDDPIVLRGGQTNGDIHVQVPALGSFKVKLRPHPNMFTTAGSGKITSVTVDYEYKDAGAPDHVADTAMVRPADLDNGVSISHLTFRQIDKPVQFTPTYLREAAPAIKGRMQQTWVQAGRESIVEIPQPWTDFLRIKARVLNVEGLKSARVDLQYDDGNFQSEGSIVLDKDSEDFAGGAWSGSTQLPQIDKTKQRFRYRYSVEGVGQLVVGPWVDAEGDQELILPVLGVKLRTDRLHIGTDFTEVLVSMSYSDATRAFETKHDFFLTKDRTSDVWLVPRVDSNQDTYTYSVTLFKLSGDPIEIKSREGHGENLVLVAPI